MSDVEHTIGLVPGRTADDWQRAYASLLRRLGAVKGPDGARHRFRAAVFHETPFELRDRPGYDLVIDRVARWSRQPMPWLDKVALVDGVYLVNSPVTLGSMEKYAAACALIRLGLKIPVTVVAQDSSAFEAAARVGYPLYVKPFEGGGVTRVRDADELASFLDGDRLLGLQAAVDDYDVCARALSIGPETMVMRYRADEPSHLRYDVDHAFLGAETGSEVVTVSRLVNAFFRWEFNSCELLVRGPDVHPIDYADACPDVAITSLHYYFPWAMAALLRWTVFCVLTGRAPRLGLDTAGFFRIGDDPGLSYAEKLGEYRRLADEYFEVRRYEEFCARYLADVGEIVHDWVSSDEFRSLLRDTVRALYPVHEHEKFLGHFGGLVEAWIRDGGARG